MVSATTLVMETYFVYRSSIAGWYSIEAR